MLDDWSYPQDLMGGELRRYDVRAVKVGDGLSQTWRDVTERFAAAREAALSDARFRAAFDALDESVVTFREVRDSRGEFADAEVTWANRAAREGWLGGVPLEELQGTRLFARHPELRAALFSVYRDVVAHGTAFHDVVAVEDPPRGRSFLDLRVTPFDGGFVHAGRDVTAEHGARLSLEESEARYRALTDSAADAIVTADFEGRITGWNAGAERMFGYARQEAAGRPVTMLMPERYRAGHPGAMRRVHEGGERHIMGTAIELQARRHDGTEFPIELTLADWEVSDRRYVTSIMRDISDRHAAAQALAYSEELFHEAFDHAAIGMCLISPEGQFLVVNPALCGILGRDAQTLLACTWQELTHPDDLEVDLGLVEDVLQDRIPSYRLLKRFLRPDGEVVWGDLSVSCVREDDRSVRNFVSQIVDVSARIAAEQEIRRLNEELEDRVMRRTAQLEASNRELEAFVYAASHDLRTPLRAIDGFSQLVADGGAERLGAEDQEHLQRVRAAAQRMGLLIDHLQELSHASAAELLHEDVDLSGMARSVLRDLLADHPGRRVDTVVEPALVVTADATLLRVVLTNLLDNALKFTAKHERARIEVGAVDLETERAFFVRDDGSGFDAESAQHLFGAFQRFHPAEDFAGEGIGLAIVQRLVARHGGRVWAESAVERGATFFFTLPEPAAALPAVTPEPAAVPPRPIAPPPVVPPPVG